MQELLEDVYMVGKPAPKCLLSSFPNGFTIFRYRAKQLCSEKVKGKMTNGRQTYEYSTCQEGILQRS